MWNICVGVSFLKHHMLGNLVRQLSGNLFHFPMPWSPQRCWKNSNISNSISTMKEVLRISATTPGSLQQISPNLFSFQIIEQQSRMCPTATQPLFVTVKPVKHGLHGHMFSLRLAGQYQGEHFWLGSFLYVRKYDHVLSYTRNLCGTASNTMKTASILLIITKQQKR